MANEFDLDVNFEEDPDISFLSIEELTQAIAKLPESLEKVAKGILLEKRTMSDVSQSLGIRQAELVSRLHRAKEIIAKTNN